MHRIIADCLSVTTESIWVSLCPCILLNHIFSLAVRCTYVFLNEKYMFTCRRPMVSEGTQLMIKLFDGFGHVWLRRVTPAKFTTWWHHQMETFSALLAICAGNSPVPGEFPAQRPVPQSFEVFFDLRLNKRLSKQSWGGWFETPSRPSWRHSIGN